MKLKRTIRKWLANPSKLANTQLQLERAVDAIDTFYIGVYYWGVRGTVCRVSRPDLTWERLKYENSSEENETERALQQLGILEIERDDLGYFNFTQKGEEYFLRETQRLRYVDEQKHLTRKGAKYLKKLHLIPPFWEHILRRR